MIPKGLSPAAKETLKELGRKEGDNSPRGGVAGKKKLKKNEAENYKRVIEKGGEKSLIMKRTQTKRKQRGRGVDIQKLLSKTGIEYHLPGYQIEEASGSRRSWENPTGSYCRTTRH